MRPKATKPGDSPPPPRNQNRTPPRPTSPVRIAVLKDRQRPSRAPLGRDRSHGADRRIKKAMRRSIDGGDQQRSQVECSRLNRGHLRKARPSRRMTWRRSKPIGEPPSEKPHGDRHQAVHDVERTHPRQTRGLGKRRQKHEDDGAGQTELKRRNEYRREIPPEPGSEGRWTSSTEGTEPP